MTPWQKPTRWADVREGPSAEDLVRAVRSAGISDERLLKAIRTTPRAVFVPGDDATAAYHDVPIPISHGQVTTSLRCPSG